MSFPTTRGRHTRRTIAGTALTAWLMMLLMGCSDGASDQADPPSPNTTELDSASLAPWPLPTDVANRVAEAGLDLGPMGMAEHYHPQLQIVVNGVPQWDGAVPEGIFLDRVLAETFA